MEEYWDVYDENRKLQSKIIRRGDPFGEGEYYVCCEAWIVNSKGEMLVTKRHPDKKAGGLWEFVGGGVLAGETAAQAAVREVQEEVGIVIYPNELVLLGVYKQRNYFMDVYLVKKDVSIRDITLNENEATDVKWATKEEIRAMIKNGVFVSSVARRFETFGGKTGDGNA